MKRIVIDIYDKDDPLGEMIEIKSDEYNFLYASAIGGHGLQCSFEDNTAEYVTLLFRLSRISDLVTKVDLSSSSKSE